MATDTPLPYEPTPEQTELISEVNGRFEKWRRTRQPHEQTWFTNAAFLRGAQYVQFSALDQRLVIPPAPSHRVRLAINRIQPKMRARRAKFLKNRPKPIVIGASPEHQDQLDARLTTKALDYQWERLQLEKKYREALLWAEQCGKGYWWFYWDPAVIGRIQTTDPFTGQPVIQEAQLGDLCIEVGSPFEILVSDPSAHSLALQPEIMRVKMRTLDEVKARYPEFADYLVAESGDVSAFRYEQQISQLNSQGTYGGAGQIEDRKGTGKEGLGDCVVMKEHFIKPNGRYPKGAYRLVAGHILLIARDELPYGFHDMENPYPVEEFIDIETVGQYYGTTLIEQLIPIQKEYNLVRSKISEQLRIMAFPKLLAARQHNIPNGAWTCVDEETTVLTREGWKNYRTLRVGEEILSYDPDTDSAKWLACQAVNSYDYIGELYSLQSRQLNALVTPNHKWWLESRKNDRPRKVKRIRTDELESIGRFGWSIPLARPGACDAILPESLEFFELLGWIAAEGCYAGNAIVIRQHKENGKARIRKLLKTLRIPHTESATQFYIPVRAVATIKRYMPNKLPEYSWLTTASEAQLSALLDGLIAGDGNIQRNGQRRFHNTSYELCEIVLTIASLLGCRASIAVAREAEAKYFGTGYGNKTYLCARQYVVYVGSIKSIDRRKPNRAGLESLSITKRAYRGKVWCPTVATGAVYFKRGDRVFVSSNSEAGEFVEYLAIPGIPPPQPWHPPNIAGDAWKALELIKAEFDDVTQVYPAAEGKVAGATSGFQTNLLQEATDMVHTPDIRLHELTIEAAAQKIRRLMKVGYTVPRLLTIIGPHYTPEVIEFSEAEIDEHAKVKVQVGSMLPDLKAARIQSGLEMFKSGVMGDPMDPAVRRHALSLIDVGSQEESLDVARADEHAAKLENADFEKGLPVPPPEFFQNHQTHYDTHAYKLKSPESRAWPPEKRMALIAHLLEHVQFLNPVSAIQLKIQYGLLPPEAAALMGPPPGASPAPPGAPQGTEPASSPAPQQESSQAL